MTDLITRLSKLDAPDREVDGEIWRYLMSDKPRAVLHGPVPKLTASVDAAIALADRVFPNERVLVNRIAFDSSHQWRASLTGNHVSWGVNPAIALCIAILRAKEASDVGN